MTKRHWLVLGIAFVLVPWAPVKIGLAALAAAGLADAMTRGGRVPRAAVLLFAAAAFWIAHVASPYWLLPLTVTGRGAALALLVLLAASWARIASSDVTWQPQRVPPWVPVLIVAALTIVCLPGLVAPLEFRGDEDVHVARPLAAIEALQRLTVAHPPTVATLIAIGVLLLALRPRLAALLSAVALLALPLVLAACFLARPPSPEILAKLGRYPILSAWLHTAAAFSPFELAPPLRHLLYQEALFRLVPFFSLLSLATWVARVVKGSAALRALLALALATPPVLLYYATALYLELPAVALITVGLYGLDVSAVRLLRGRVESGALLALAVGLLLKESAAALGLAAVAAVSALLFAARGSAGARLRASARLAAVVLTPAAVYLFWRTTTPALRALRASSFDPAPLGNPDLYWSLPGAMAVSLGAPLLLLAAVGVVVSVRRRPWAVFIWGSSLLGMLLLLAGDWVTTTTAGPLPAHWGHSRMLLLTFPPICCFAIEACRFLCRRSAGSLTAAAGLVILAHLWLRPLGWDGSRPARWGDLVSEAAGERYPYDDLYLWLARAGVRGEMLILGRDYSYRDDFYLGKYALDLTVRTWPTRTPRSPDLQQGTHIDAAWRELQEQLLAAGQATVPVVVAHVPEGIAGERLPQRTGLLHREMIFGLGTQHLVVYRTGPNVGSFESSTR